METVQDRNRVAREVFTGLPDRYDLLAQVLSLGQDRRWRREMLRHVDPREAPHVLDVATGPAGVALALAGRGARVTGVDLTPGMLERGARNVEAAGAGDRVRLALARAEELPFDDASFDGLTFTYLLRYVDDPAATLRELARVVRPGGPVASLDFYVPPNGLFRAGWWLYTRGVLPAAGWLTGGEPWRRVGRFLGPNIEEHYRRLPLADLVEAWRSAGLVDVEVRPMTLGAGLVMWGRRSPDG